MGKIKISRRSLIAAPAAISLAAASGASANAAAAPTLGAVALLIPDQEIGRGSPSSSSAASSPLTTVFSCGSRWSAAKSCSALCPSGDDDACPPGQYCYGGTTCRGGPDATDGALERQRLLEAEETDRLVRRREEEYERRCACGTSFDDAAERCASSFDADADADYSFSVARGAVAHDCPDGSSSHCPADTRCYAAVPCPRASNDGEGPLRRRQLLLVAEPVALIEDVVSDGNGSGVSEGEGGRTRSPVTTTTSDWGSLARESSAAVLGTMSALFSSRYGVN